MNKVIYDGAFFCGQCSCGCPIIEHDDAGNMVTIFDPTKPENGRFTMTVAEYNALIANAKPVERR